MLGNAGGIAIPIHTTRETISIPLQLPPRPAKTIRGHPTIAMCFDSFSKKLKTGSLSYGMSNIGISRMHPPMGGYLTETILA